MKCVSSCEKDFKRLLTLFVITGGALLAIGGALIASGILPEERAQDFRSYGCFNSKWYEDNKRRLQSRIIHSFDKEGVFN